MYPRTVFRADVDGRLEALHRLDDSGPYYVASNGQLGSGGTAQIKWCWKQTSTGLALFAVKMPKEEVADLDGINGWLGTEEEALQILAGVPRTVQLEGSGCTSDGRNFVVMELVPGETLAQTGKDLTALPDKGLWLQHAALQLLQIVHELHTRGLAWRDASLSNAMCETDDTGIPNLTAIDFGACVAMPPDGLVWIDEVSFFATPNYTAPELISLELLLLSGSHHRLPPVQYSAAKADSWPIGAMLYELTVGEGLMDSGPGMTTTPQRAAGGAVDALQHQLAQLHNCHIQRRDNQVWHDEMRAQLVAGSGSDDFAELVLHLLHYDSRQRWTVTQALQEPCTQAINAACGHPSTAVPMLHGALSSPDSASGPVSQQSSGTDMSDDIIMFPKQPDVLEHEDNLNAQESPRIPSVPGSVAQQYGHGHGHASLPPASSDGFNWTPLFGSYDTVQPTFGHSDLASNSFAAHKPENAVNSDRFGQEIPARGGLDVERMFASELAAVSDSSTEASSVGDVDSDAAMLLPSDLMDELDAIPAEPASHQAVATADNYASEMVGSAAQAAQFSSELCLRGDDSESAVGNSSVAADGGDEEVQAGNVYDHSSDISSDVSSEDDSEEFEARLEAAFKAAHQLQEIEGIPAVFQTAGRPICQLAVGKLFRGYARSANRWSCCLIKRAALYHDDAESEEDQSSEADSSSLPEEEGSAREASTGNSSLTSEDSDPTEPIAITEDDVDRHNSNITAQELMEQQCPELLVGDLTPDLTDRYLYSITLLSGKAVTLHEMMTQQGGLQTGAVRQQLVKTMARNLLQVLAVLHEQGHFLGAITPQQVLVEPLVCLADHSTGAIRLTPVTLEHSALDTIHRFNKGVHFTEVGTAAGDLWSLGVLLYETAVGRVPFPLTYQPHKGTVLADLRSINDLMIEASAHQTKWQELHWWAGSDVRQALAAHVDPPIAALVLSLLHPNPNRRLTAAAALQLPCLQLVPATVAACNTSPAEIALAEDSTAALEADPAEAAAASSPTDKSASAGAVAASAPTAEMSPAPAADLAATGETVPETAVVSDTTEEEEEDAAEPDAWASAAVESDETADAACTAQPAAYTAEDCSCDTSRWPRDPPFWARTICRTGRAAGWLAGKLVKSAEAHPFLAAAGCVAALQACRKA